MSIMLKYEDALRLGSGDVILVRGTARMILKGPRDGPPPRRNSSIGHPAIYFHFPILHRSWTGRAYTCYLWNDIKNIASLPPSPLLSKEWATIERDRLLSQGFDVDREIKREIAEDERMSKIHDEPTSPAVRFMRICSALHKRKNR